MFRSVDLKRMLNEDKNNDDIMSYNTHEDGMSSRRSVYSLVSEDGSENAPYNNHDEKLGLLILEGQDDDDDDKEAFDGSGTDQDDELSIPDTVNLPSDMKSILSTHHHRHHHGEVNSNMADDSTCTLSKLKIYLTSHVYAILIISLLIVTSLLSIVEVLRMREDLQKQRSIISLLPITASLLKERKDLLKKQEMLEDEIERLKRNDASHRSNLYEDIFTSNDTDDSSILSIKNCYMEARVSLGTCSKEWQEWLYASSSKSSSSEGEEASDDDYDDMYQSIVKSFKDGVRATSSQLKELSSVFSWEYGDDSLGSSNVSTKSD